MTKKAKLALVVAVLLVGSLGVIVFANLPRPVVIPQLSANAMPPPSPGDIAFNLSQQQDWLKSPERRWGI